MKTSRLIGYVAILLASMHLVYGQHATKTWTQSRAEDFSANQLLNLAPVQAPGLGIQLSLPVTKTLGDQYDNSMLRFLAKDRAGNYVATTDAAGTVRTQRYTAAGVPVGGAITVNDAPAFRFAVSRAALFDDGTYVVVWPGDNENMRGQVVGPNDLKVGSNFVINDTTNISNSSPVVYANRGDQLFWIFYSLITPQGYRLHVQKRDKSGNKVGETFLLDTGTLKTLESDPAVAPTAGGFTVAWPASNSNLSEELDLYLREFNNDGTPVAATVKVNDDGGTYAQQQPVLCTDDSMNVLVAWIDQRDQGSTPDRVFGQLFDSHGMRLGVNIRMTTINARSPDLTYSSGEYRLSWNVWNEPLRVYETMWSAWKVAPVTWGSMISSVHDAGPGGTLLKSIAWVDDRTANGSIQMKVRSNDLLQNLQSTAWHGPLDTAGYYTNPAGEEIGPFANAGRYMQYAAYFSGAHGQSPVLRSVSIVSATEDSVPPAKPARPGTTTGHHSITLAWSANHETDLAGYRVYRGSAIGVYGQEAVASIPVGATSFVDYSPVPDSVYHYAISAFDSCDNESALSDDASASPAPLAIYVTKGASGEGDGSLMNPFPTISQGLAVALAGDTVIVLEGTFSELLSIRAGVSLVGSGAQRCTITGGFEVHDGSVIRGFTFNSMIRCVDGRATIEDNVWSSLVQSYDPAIDVRQAAAPSILHNLIIKSGQYSAGIQDFGESPHIIRNNLISAPGAGIVLVWDASPTIINNTIIGSSAPAIIGGWTGSIIIGNNILVSHRPINPRGLETSASAANIFHNDIFPAGERPVTGYGNIFVNPQFVNEGAQNLHVLPASPTRDAGNPESQYNDIDGSRNDIGAYGGPDPFPEGPPVPIVRSVALTGGSGLPGDTVGISIRVDDPRAIRGGSFTLDFDPALLMCARVAPGSAVELVHDVAISPGAVTFLFDTGEPLQTGQENLGTVFLVVAAKAAAGDASPVAFRTASLLDVNHQPVILKSVTSGAVVVNQYADGVHRRFVDAANTGTENGTRSHPWKSIVKAMTVARAGDSILVSGGMYSEGVVMKDSVHLVGSGAAVTVLDAPPNQPAVSFENIHSGDLSGFTLRAGGSHEPAWPLVVCSASSPTLRSNSFQTVSAGVPGIHCYNGGTPTIHNNYFNGTPVLVAGSSPILDGNVLEGANGPEASLVCTGSSAPTISRNRIDGGMGIGIRLTGGTAMVSNNWISCGIGLQPAMSVSNLASAIVRNNVFCDSTSRGTGITIGSSTGVDVVNNTFITHLRGIVESNSSLRFLNNIVTGASDKGLQGSTGTASNFNDLWNNAANYGGVAPGADDFSKDPQFKNPALGDYRLGPASPCINAGNPATEFLDRDGTRNDVGAYGGPYADTTLFTGCSTVLSFDSVHAATTDTIHIPLHGVDVNGVAGLAIKLSYDAAFLRVIGVRAGEVTRQFAVELTGVAVGHDVISLRSGRGITDSRGDLLTLVCVVRQGGTGTTVIRCDSATAADESMAPRACTPPGDCRIAISPLGIAAGGPGPLPSAFSLLQNYPNPFNPATTIVYEVPRTEHISLAIFDILGRRVVTLVDGIRTPGRYTLDWNAVSQSSGVYFCRMQAGSFAMAKKLLLVR